MPWTVKVIPNQYRPPIPGVVSLVTAEIGVVFIILITSMYFLRRHSKEGLFFLLWYMVIYLPVSNLILIANPMACRYMYLPSVGLLIVLAFVLHKAFKNNFLKVNSKYLSSMLCGAVILILVTKTLFLNNDWKNDFGVAWAWVRDYPGDNEGYALLGMKYGVAHNFKKAKECLEKSVRMGDPRPVDAFFLALCYRQLGEVESAEALLKQIILLNPNYADPMFCLGEIYYNQKKYGQARGMLEKALMLNPNRSGGRMLLMKVYLNLHKKE
jgi:tetratricopeptide (TPR) repeat protein